MIGVVQEEHEIPEAHQGVGAGPRLAEVGTVAMHITDHVNSHAAHLMPVKQLAGRAPTCGYFRVTRVWDYCARSQLPSV
ncbi:hypothetical protein GCM10023324_37520 [Streptomyces youssoufiensis]